MVKKILIIFAILFVTTNIVLAENQAKTPGPRIKLSNKNFELKFSNCTKDSTVCMNEYYRLKEKDLAWTELVTVHYFKYEKSPLGYAKTMKLFNKYSDLFYDKERDSAMLSFGIPFKMNKENYVEQNILRVEKSKYRMGCTAIQYAVRHKADENLKTLMQGTLDKYLTKIFTIEIPDIVLEPMQKW